MMMRSALLGVVICSIATAGENILQQIRGDKLESLLPEDGRTLVLFTRPNGCSSCAAVTAELQTVLSELPVQASFTVEDPTHTETYADRVPALVLFHGHTPMLYEGPMTADAFAEFVMTNPEPRVTQLNDESFEGMTQAATGATTGDWLVMFHGLECRRCAALESRLQGVAAKLRSRVVVAKVSSQTDGRETAKRFGVDPTQMRILFFRLGTMYSYDSEKLDLVSLSAFAVGLYKEAASQPVPGEPQGPMMLVLQICGVLLILAYVGVSVMNRRREEQQRKKGF